MALGSGPVGYECPGGLRFLLRASDGSVTVDRDACEFGLFPRRTWLRTFERAGLQAETVEDPWRKDVFVAHPS
jgi:hypothetical protein